MRAHVFITDQNTFPIVRDNGFCAVGVKDIPATLKGIFARESGKRREIYVGMVGDIFGTRIGDIVFIYERQIGFHGVYKITSAPFFDPTAIGCVGAVWPIRVEIECLNYFAEPVPEEYLFSTKEYESKFWGWFYRKIQGSRAISTLNPEAAEALIELLVKINGNAVYIPSTIGTYPSSNKQEIILPLSQAGQVQLEAILRAWVISNIDKPERQDVEKLFGPAGDIEWFANNVPYHVSGKNVDILCYHKNKKYTGIPLRYKFSVVELKRDKANDENILQVVEYSKWVAGRLAGSEIETVQPILIAFDFNKKALEKARNSDFNERGILLVKYRVENEDIKLEVVDY